MARSSSHKNGSRSNSAEARGVDRYRSDSAETGESSGRTAVHRRGMPITDGPFAESKEMVGGGWAARTFFAEEI